MPAHLTPVKESDLEVFLGAERKGLLDESIRRTKDNEKAREEKLEEEIKARYKIEILFGKERSMSSLKTSVGVVTIWESGKRFHGGGDQKMYWCGYDDCGKPIRESGFGIYHTVCPHCQREVMLDENSKKGCIADAKRRGHDTKGIAAMPVIAGERYFRLPPPKLASLLEKLWYELECSADVYLKYHPTDIRYNIGAGDNEVVDHLEKSRTGRGQPSIYTLSAILKDTASGASLHSRLLSFVTA